MRVEATIPESRGTAIQELADQLGLSRSQIIDEALSLFLKAVIEIRQGRKLVTQDPSSLGPLCELTTPTLTTLEWALRSSQIELSDEAMKKVSDLRESPPPPGDRLRKALKKDDE